MLVRPTRPGDVLLPGRGPRAIRLRALFAGQVYEVPDEIAEQEAGWLVPLPPSGDGPAGTDASPPADAGGTDESEESELAGLSVAELRARAKAAGLRGYSKLKRAELEAAIAEAEGG
jgi:hypothetical protein